MNCWPLATARPAARRARCSRRRCGACSPIPRAEALVAQLRGPVAPAAQSAEHGAGQGGVSGLRRQPPAVVPAGDRAALRQHRPRGPQRRRSADGRLHVRGRAPGEALRHPGRLRQPLPPRRASPTRRAAACSARAASSRSRRTPIGPRRWCAASGCSTTCSARRRRRRRPTCRRSTKARRRAARRCASGWSSTAGTRRARAVTRSWTRSASRSRTSTPIGAWRTMDGARRPIDAAGQLSDGSRVDGPVSLRKALLRGVRCSWARSTEKLLDLRARAQRRVLATCRRFEPSSAQAARERLSVVVDRPAASSRARRFRCARRTGPARRCVDEGVIMFITKRSLPRRTFLRGLGTTVACRCSTRWCRR